MKKKNLSVLILRIIIVLLALFGMFFSQINNGVFNISKFIYFTYQSNLIVAISYFILIIKTLPKKNNNSIPSLPKTIHFFITFTITTTFVIFILFLTGYKSDLTGSALVHLKIGSTLLHFVVPLLVIYDYFANVRNENNHYLYFFYNLIYPSLYLVFVFIRAQYGGILNVGPLSNNSYYPYPFLDIDQLGSRQIIINIILLLGILILISLIMTFIDKKINKVYSNFITTLFREERKAKTEKGWDFSYIAQRISEPNLPWDYKAAILKYLNKTDILLDLGTGGGEFLLTLNHNPHHIYVTEAYSPNYRLCRKKLSNLGIKVIFNNSPEKLPFPNNFFDIIINRHDEYHLGEINRVLKPGGYFLTQQVGSLDCDDLIPIFTKKESIKQNEFSLNREISSIDEEQWQIIEKDEDITNMYFFDIGALVYFVARLPWQFPTFKVKNKVAQLEVLNNIIKKQGYISTPHHRFFFVLKKII